MNLTWLDSNSWLIEIAGKRLLLDPWLVDSLVFGNLTWLFAAKRRQTPEIPENIDLILLSQGLEDHAHTPTLKELDHSLPVVASVNGAKVVQELGYTQVNALTPGETFTLDNRVEIKAVVGSPIGPTIQENGYLIKDLETGYTLYYEPHGYHSPTLKEVGRIDVIITPLIDIKIPLLGPVIKGQKSALEVCQWVNPQFILPTAAGKEIVYEGLLNMVLQTSGNVADFQGLLSQNNLKTQVIDPTPWEKLEITAPSATATS